MNLAAQQTALLDVLHLNTIDSIALYEHSIPATGLFSLNTPASTLRGLRAYRANAQALAESALLGTYPVIRQLIGNDNFRHIAEDFWQAMPPERGDLAQWGRKLPEYLPQVPQLQALLQDHPYLSDVARVEWALHAAATASDADLDAASFQLLASQDPAQLRLLLSSGCALIRSPYPIVALIQLHDPRTIDSHEAARDAIKRGDPQTALIWRRGWRPLIGATQLASAAFIEATLQGQPLSLALDAAFAQTPGFDFSAWLAAQVSAGLLLGAAMITDA
jgi:Putative DNA-binding domain